MLFFVSSISIFVPSLYSRISCSLQVKINFYNDQLNYSCLYISTNLGVDGTWTEYFPNLRESQQASSTPTSPSSPHHKNTHLFFSSPVVPVSLTQPQTTRPTSGPHSPEAFKGENL